MTDQEKQNVQRIYALAEKHIAKLKRGAVNGGDFEGSLRLADNQARIENFLRGKGVMVGEQKEKPND